MNALPTPESLQPSARLSLARLAMFPRMRALAWAGDVLYASRQYELLKAAVSSEGAVRDLRWDHVGAFRPPWWRTATSANRLSFRLVRDGFHALAVLPSGGLVGAVPGAIVQLKPGENEFRITHAITRGTRPLHITALPNGTVVWGEYFDNAARAEVHIYASPDAGAAWSVVYTFPRGTIRHIHNIVHDPWQDCLWILTGDYGNECQILRASYDFSKVVAVMRGNQQARAVACIPAEDGIYFSSDTPLEANHICHLDRQGKLSTLATIGSSSIFGCRVGASMFFSTMVEPRAFNTDKNVRVYGAGNLQDWHALRAWKKDLWPMALFQYGNAILPDGVNSSPCLALTTIAVTPDDLATSLFSLRAE